ncbi:hypothetical protein EV401DRAFT_178505 [Pisolithus croceorrhizus]|nr:hypothetical protein EV401DRAFT_178505 [Pisolithus croceorrhizus]
MTSRSRRRTAEGRAPTDLQIPTLGYSVRLGELFDERTSSFLGVQLYEEKSAEVAVTSIRRTDLTLSSTNSFEHKASLLDIQAGLSLAIIGGLVKLDESLSSYLNSAKSNSRSQSWSLALKIQTGERRLLFAQTATNVLDTVKEDYISQKRATHFVSSIICGGNLIIGMTERATEATDEGNAQGELEFEIKQLGGAVSLSTEVDAKIKARFEGMNSKVDLDVYSDIKPLNAPIHPADVLDIFPQAAKLLLGDPNNGTLKGVPVSVILRPIPESILNDAEVAVPVYQISRPLIHGTLRVFVQLEDVRKRFHVVNERTAIYKDYIPKLSLRVLTSAWGFNELYIELTEKLGQFLRDMMTNGDSDLTSSGSGGNDKVNKEKKKSFDFPGSFPSVKHYSVLEQALYLLQSHTDISYRNRTGALGRDPNVEALASLERAFLDFQYLVDDIRRAVGGRLINGNSLVNLSSLADVSRVLRRSSTIHLFIMTPLDIPGGDVAVIRFLALLRQYKNKESCILYIEDFSQLEKLPNGEMFFGLNEPAYYVGTVDKVGELCWKLRSDRVESDSSSTPVKTISVTVSPLPGKTTILCPVSVPLTIIDGTKSFSIVFEAKLGTMGSLHGKQVTLSADGGDIDFTFEPVGATCSGGGYLASDLRTSVTVDKQEPFIVAFVQDTRRSKAYLYVNGQLRSSALFSVSTLGQQWAKREFIYRMTKDEDTETCVSASIHRAAIYNVAPTVVCLPFR